MLPERLSSVFKTASQGLAVQREKIAVASRNIANADTSSPVDSDRVYRPQSVKSLAPDQKSFKSVLRNSISTLQRTHPKHISPSAEPSGENQKGPQAIGPQFEVAEKDRFRFEYDPNHPDADENGMVRYPDIDMIREMTQMVSASRLYEAILSSIEAEKQIMKRSLEI